MAAFEVDFTYRLEEYGFEVLEANDAEQAEDFAKEHILSLYPDIVDIEIDAVREVTHIG